MFRSNGLFQDYTEIKALKLMLWKPGHTVHASGGHFSFHHSHSTTCLYVREYVEPAQKEGSLRTGARLLILDGEIITAFNMQNQKKQKQNKTLISFKYKREEDIIYKTQSNMN